MRTLLIIFLFISSTTFGQLTIKTAQDSLNKYHLGASTYFNDFIGHRGYGAGVILTKDGGAAGFGDGDFGTELIKLGKMGNVQWRKSIKKQFESTEPQCVAHDTAENFYVFILNYNPVGDRSGSEQVLCFDRKGTLLWDKMLGNYTLLNNPNVSYVRKLKDGRIEMRGHIVTTKPVAGKDPVYQYWQGWFDSKGTLTQQIGEVLNWSNPDTMKKFKPE